MKSFGPEIKGAEKPTRPIPKKAMLWAAQDGWGILPNGDRDRFPDKAAIAARNLSEWPKPLATFGEAVSQAQERVWIIDPHFLDPDKGNRQTRVDQIVDWMLERSFAASDIRFLTASHHKKEVDDDLAKQFAEYAEMISSNRPRGPRCNIEVRFTLRKNFNYVHDRFAIIDDELWHFGATVGGFHSQVSAATRGWRAADHGAVEFFYLAWEPELNGGPQK
jgi:phosphatidylserine/phosphatidylglycerophosphate/cardiolipin synthase-like enzyme